jgi:hypothetical protein
MATLTCFSYSLACNFECVEYYEGGTRVLRPPIKWQATADKRDGTLSKHSAAETHRSMILVWRCKLHARISITISFREKYESAKITYII